MLRGKISNLVVFLFILSFLNTTFAQEALLVETNKKVYTVSEDSSLNNYELTITNKGNQAYIILHVGPAGMNWFNITYKNVDYHILDSRYFSNFQVEPEYMRERLIVDRPEGIPHWEGYLLKPGEKITWIFNPLHFGHTDQDIDWSKIDEPDKMVDLNTIFEFRYMAKDTFPEGKTQTAISNSFIIRCKKSWFYLCSKSLIAESIGPDSDRELVRREIDYLLKKANYYGRYITAYKLGTIIGDERVTLPLIEILEADIEFETADYYQTTLMCAAIEALAKNNEGKAKEPILNILRKTAIKDRKFATVMDPKLKAIEACGRLRIKESLPILMDIARIEKDDYAPVIFEEKEKAIRAIGMIGSNEAYNLLIEILVKAKNKIHYGWQNLCISSAEALADIGDKRAVAFLESHLKDLEGAKWRDVRKAFKEALKKLKKK